MMTFEQEKKNVIAVAEAARAFVACYDEFDGDPGCVGELLDALVTAMDGLGNEGEGGGGGMSSTYFDGQSLSGGKVASLAGGYCVAVYRCLCGREQMAQCEGFSGGLSEEAARTVGWNFGDRGWMCPFCSGETDKLFQVFEQGSA